MFFWREFAQHISTNVRNKEVKIIFLKHSELLIRSICSAFHEKYLKELIFIIYLFHGSREKKELVNFMAKDPDLSEKVKDLLYKIEYYYYLNNEEEVKAEFSLSRRGRKKDIDGRKVYIDNLSQLIILGGRIRITI